MEFMEVQCFGQGSSFHRNSHDSFVDPFLQYEKYACIPVQAKLKQNKERRLLIQKEKQKEKQFILQKRRQKQDNVQRVLKQRHEARENAKNIFASMQKTFANKFDEPIKRADEIEQKINECRTRANQYRTMYKRKIQDSRQGRQKSVRQRKRRKDNKQNDRSINYHLAEWRSYEKRVAQKYKKQINPNRLYEGFIKKQNQLRQLLQKQREFLSEDRQGFSAPIENSSKGFKRILIKKQDKHQFQQSNVLQKSNPIYSVLDISGFGLSKSFKNPQKNLKEMKQFLQINIMLEQPQKDQELILKFQEYLNKQAKDL